MTQNLIYVALAIAGGTILASIADMATGYPFGGVLVSDIIFLIASGAVVWMGLDCLKGMRRKK